MLKTGDKFENATTGEFGYIRLGVEKTDGKLMVADLRVSPGGKVMGEHIHQNMAEKFTVISGKLGYSLNGKKGVIGPKEFFEVPTNSWHDWWNAGEDEAHVIVEFRPPIRFIKMMTTFFGLARDGKTNDEGLPNLLQLAVINQEFSDVLQLKSPPIWAQKLLFGVLAPIGRLLGYRATYPEYESYEAETVEIEDLPDWLVIEV